MIKREDLLSISRKGAFIASSSIDSIWKLILAEREETKALVEAVGRWYKALEVITADRDYYEEEFDVATAYHPFLPPKSNVEQVADELEEIYREGEILQTTDTVMVSKSKVGELVARLREGGE